jgi:hypothetical protein
MKKTFLIVLLLCMTAYGIFAEDPPASYLPAGVTIDQLPSGVIKELTGKVQLRTIDSSTFVIAKVGDEIKPTTIVSTGMKSTAVIVVGNLVINVAPVTRKPFSEILVAAAEGKLLPGGKLSCCE